MQTSLESRQLRKKKTEKTFFLFLTQISRKQTRHFKAKESIKICQNQRPFARFITASGILQDAQNKWKRMTHAKHFFSEITEPNCGMEKSFFLCRRNQKFIIVIIFRVRKVLFSVTLFDYFWQHYRENYRKNITKAFRGNSLCLVLLHKINDKLQ